MGKYLSFGGRITLLKSVLSALPVFFLSAFNCPKKVISSLERIMKDFLWNDQEDRRKEHLVSWQQVCLPIKVGGIGIRSIKDLNLALPSKWLWRIGSDVDAPWKFAHC